MWGFAAQTHTTHQNDTVRPFGDLLGAWIVMGVYASGPGAWTCGGHIFTFLYIVENRIIYIAPSKYCITQRQLTSRSMSSCTTPRERKSMLANV